MVFKTPLWGKGVVCAVALAAIGGSGAVSTFQGQTDRLDARAPAPAIESATIGYGAAVHINSAGQVLVVADAAGNAVDRTFVWSPSSGLREIRFSGTTGATRGSDLSDGGIVVGEALSPRGISEPFVWSEPAGIRILSVDPVLANASAAAVNTASTRAALTAS